MRISARSRLPHLYGALALLTLAVFPASRVESAAGTPRARTVVAQGHGVLLALTMWRTSYPRDALVWADLRLRNISSGTVGIVRECGESDPLPEVLNSRGKVVYPPAMPLAAAPSGCAPSRPITLARRHELHIAVPVVLRGTSIQAAVYVVPPNRIVAGPGTLVQTPRIQVGLTSEQSPAITLSLQHGVSVDVHSPVAVSGKMYAGVSYLCWRANGAVAGGITPWKPEPSHIAVLSGTCRSLVLHVVAGWPGHAVGELDYQSK